MKPFILGFKSVQSQIFTEKGDRVSATTIDIDDCYLIGFRTKEKDGYNALIIGFSKPTHESKPNEGKRKKAGIKTQLSFYREYRVDEIEYDKEDQNKVRLGDSLFSIGDKLTPSIFTKGTLVQVTGVSKGKGFQGVVKRHSFRGGPRTHGQSDRERAPGSIGATTTPGRIFKGKKMAGRMGGDRVTVKNLLVVNSNDTQLFVKGSVPGSKKGLLIIKGI